MPRQCRRMMSFTFCPRCDPKGGDAGAVPVGDKVAVQASTATLRRNRVNTPLRLGGIQEESVVDGPGLRFVVFTQGCPHRCAGCHNPETHDPSGGFVMDTRDILEQFRQNPLLAGITFSGGEPFMQPAPLAFLARAVKNSGKTVVVYTGYTLEQLLASADAAVRDLLALADILIDGPYIESLRDLDLAFRGSSNQRMLDAAAIQALHS